MGNPPSSQPIYTAFSLSLATRRLSILRTDADCVLLGLKLCRNKKFAWIPCELGIGQKYNNEKIFHEGLKHYYEYYRISIPKSLFFFFCKAILVQSSSHSQSRWSDVQELTCVVLTQGGESPGLSLPPDEFKTRPDL